MEQEEQLIRLKWKCITDFRKLFVKDKAQFVQDHFNFSAEIKKAKRGSRLGLIASLIFISFYLFQLFSGATEGQLNVSMWMTLLFLMMWMDSSNKLNNLEVLQLLEKLSNKISSENS